MRSFLCRRDVVGSGPERDGRTAMGHAQGELGGQAPNQASTPTGPVPATTNGQLPIEARCPISLSHVCRYQHAAQQNYRTEVGILTVSFQPSPRRRPSRCRRAYFLSCRRQIPQLNPLAPGGYLPARYVRHSENGQFGPMVGVVAMPSHLRPEVRSLVAYPVRAGKGL
jgi:hypothetical protein